MAEAELRLAASRSLFQREARCGLAQERDKVDRKLHDMITKPIAAFRSFRLSKCDSAPSVKKLNVGDKVYSGEKVADGMLSHLTN